jgi:hypothetical protein
VGGDDGIGGAAGKALGEAWALSVPRKNAVSPVCKQNYTRLNFGSPSALSAPPLLNITYEGARIS